MIVSQFGVAYPPGMLAGLDLEPPEILMRDGGARRQWNDQRRAYGDAVLAETGRILAAQREERQAGHFIIPGDPDAIPAAKAPRPSLTGGPSGAEVAIAAALIASQAGD